MEKSDGCEKKFKSLKEKFNLPAFEEIERYFEIADIDCTSSLLLSKIRQKMHEKIESYAAYLDSVLQPESTLGSLYEARYLDDDRKKTAYTLYKQCMLLLRKSKALDIENIDSDNAAFIKDTLERWKIISTDLKKILMRSSDLWNTDTDIKEDLSYFG